MGFLTCVFVYLCLFLVVSASFSSQHQYRSQRVTDPRPGDIQLPQGGSRHDRQDVAAGGEEEGSRLEVKPEEAAEDHLAELIVTPVVNDSLPSLPWNETAQIRKCCPLGAALARPPDGSMPECQPAPDDQSWQPLLLDGSSGLHVPPDERITLVHGNVTCVGGYHYWMGSSAGDPDGFELLTTGHLYLRRPGVMQAPLSFCADRLLIPQDQKHGKEEEESSSGALAARVCALSMGYNHSVLNELHQPGQLKLMPECKRRPCLRKCCPTGFKIRWIDGLCVPQTGARPWQPPWQQQEDPTGGPTTTPPASEEPLTVFGNPACTLPNGRNGGVYSLEPYYNVNHTFSLRKDGRLQNQNATVPLEDFCVDQVQYIDRNTSTVFDHHAAIVCGVHADEGTRLYIALVLVSALFLLVTLLVYCAVPELRNLHGRCLLSHVAALLTAYSCYVAGQMETVYSRLAVCQISALLMYFSFLAACFWLNAMSFDIWLTFSRLRSAAPNRSQTGRFIKYSVYCWCCPLVLTAVVIIMQFVPDRLVPPGIPRPQFGKENCWFPEKSEMLVYFHIPILVLMTANIIFFLLTAKNLMQTEKDTRMAGRQTKGLERFKIYVNLFIVMGITWIAEGLSMHVGPEEFWIVTDVFNALQGFFIFLLFTLRRNTRNTIRRHFAASRLGRCCPWAGLTPGLSSSRKTGSTSVPSGVSYRNRQRGDGDGENGNAGERVTVSATHETAELCGEGEERAATREAGIA